jgi:hypothetical protein
VEARHRVLTVCFAAIIDLMTSSLQVMSQFWSRVEDVHCAAFSRGKERERMNDLQGSKGFKALIYLSTQSCFIVPNEKISKPLNPVAVFPIFRIIQKTRAL